MSLELQAVETFVRVAELAHFTRAAGQLGVSKSRASTLIRGLEAQLGTQLLQRTTRAVQLTADGEVFLSRAIRLLDEAEAAASLFSAPSGLRGRLRVDLPVNIAKARVIPRLPEFLSAHPHLELLLSTTDRRVDVLREGFDCVLRVGPLDDSSLVARKLGAMPMMNCASPGYLQQHGTPQTLADLDRHWLVHYSSRLGSEPATFEYRHGAGYRQKPMRVAITVNSVDAYHAACVAGLGLVQVPRVPMAQALERGEVVECVAGAVVRAAPRLARARLRSQSA